MPTSIPDLLTLQWLLIGGLIGLHFLIGFFRGAQKSLYFVITNIITTVVVIFLISQVSIRFVFNFIPEADFFNTINGYAGGFLDPYLTYLDDPSITATLYLFIDLILRIVFFFTLMPIMKRFLSLILFRPIWAFGIKKAIIRHQNKDIEGETDEKGRPIKPSKKIHKGALSRLLGGLFGGINGMIVAFLILLPITVMASFVSVIDTEALQNLNQPSDTVEVGVVSDTLGMQIPQEVIDYLNQVKDMDQNGISQVFRQITVDGIPFDQYVFDEVFTVQAVYDEETYDVNFIRELQILIDVTSIIINNGYLEEDFDINSLDAEDQQNLVQLMGYIEESSLLAYLFPVAIDYGINAVLEDQAILDMISWKETNAEKEAYLRDRLAFITEADDKVSVFKEIISDFSGLLEVIASDEYGPTNLETIINSGGDLGVILENQNPDWVSAIIHQITEIDILMRALPILTDYALYEIGGDSIDETVANQLSDDFSQDGFWEGEFTNFDNIYQSVVQLSLQDILVENPDYATYIDELVANNMDDVRDIVSFIFTDSAIVNSALESLAPQLIDRFLTDEDLKEIVQSIVLDDTDQYDFELGQEFVNILNIVEGVYTFADTNSLQNFGSLTQEEKLQLFADFGAMPDADYQEFIQAFDDLQILSKIDQDVAELIVNNFDLQEQVYLPTTFSMDEEFVSILGMVHDVGVFLNDNYTSGSYEDINLTNLLSVLSDDLLLETKRSDLVFYNIAFYAKKFATDEGSLSDVIAIPDSLSTADIESTAWSSEITSLVGAIFDIATAIGETDGITLSVKDMSELFGDTGSMPVEIITQFSDQQTANDAFSSLDSSLVLRSTIANLIDSQEITFLDYVISTPAHLKTDGALNTGVFTDFIQGLATFASALNDDLGFETLSEFTFDDLSIYFSAYNDLTEAELATFVETDLLKGIVSEMLLDTDFQAGLATTLNDAQDIFDIPSDFFAPDPLLVNGPVLVDGEITHIFQMVQALKLEGTDAFGSIGLETFTNLVIEDPVTGEDDFDKFFASDYIYTVIDKILQLDSLSNYVGDTLGSSLGDADFSTLDLSIPDEMLGQTADVGTTITAIEEDRIPKAEFRRIFESLGALGSLDELGLETFTNMIDPSNEDDDFATFIASDFIYVVLSRLIGNEGFASYAEDAMGGAFGDDPVTLDMSVPTDAQGTTGVENGFITRVELRNLMVSFKMLGFGGENDLDVGTIISMPTLNTYSQTQDDLDIFLNSIFLRDKISQMLLSDTIVDLIGAGQFTSADFNLPTNAYDSESRLSQLQIHKLFDSLVLMGISDFDNLDIGIDTVTNLTTQEQTDLLSSLYLYTVVDLMIKANEAVNPGDTGLTIPLDAYYSDGGFYDGMIKDTEIINVLGVFDIVGSDPNGIDPNTITISDLEAVLALNSVIINQMISDQIETALTIDSTTVPEAYETTVGVDRILSDEMKALVASMTELGLTDLSGSFAVDNVGPTELQNLHYLGLGTDPVDEKYDSYIIHTMITDQIETALTVDDVTLPEAYNTSSGESRLNADEVQALIETMTVMGITDLSASISVDSVGVTQLRAINYLGLGTDPVDEKYDSYIIHTLITEQIETALSVDDTIVPEAYNNTSGQVRMNADEISALIESMDVIGITDFSVAVSVDAVDVSDLQDLHYLGLGTDPVDEAYDSYIIHNLITEQIETALSIDDTTIPEAYNTSSGTSRMDADEIQALIESMTVMGISDLSVAISVDTVGPAELQDLHYLGLGIDPVDEKYNSYIIHVLIYEQIETALSVSIATLPEAYTNVSGTDRMLADEVQALIESMTVMGITDFSASLSADNLTQAQIQNLHYLGLGDNGVSDPYDSSILHRMISDGIKSAVTNLPYNVYMANNDILADEVQGVISAIAVLNTDPNASLASMSFANGGLTAAKIENLLDLDSLIIYRQISSGIISAGLDVAEAYTTVGAPNYDAAYVEGNLTIDEMYGLVAAMNEMGISDLSGSFDPNTITVSQLQNLHYIGLGDNGVSDPYDSTIVHHMISDGVLGVLTNIPTTVYLANSENDITAVEVQGVIGAVAVLNTDPNATLASMSFANSGLTPDKIEDLLDLNSLIVDRQISEGIRSANLDISEAYAILTDTNYDPGYATGDLKISEMYALVAAMNEMGISDLSGSFDPNSITVAKLQNLHYIGLGIDPVTDTYDSVIVHHMISDGIASALTNRPSTVYMSNSVNDITAAEVQGVISAVSILNTDPNATLATMSFANGGLTPSKISDLLDLNSLIVDRQISEGIISASLDVSEAYAESGDTNYDPSYGTGDLTITEMYALVEAMNIMGISDLSGAFDPSGITVADLQDLHYVGLGIDPVTDEYQSYIVHHMISDAVASTITNKPTNVYMTNTEADILADELQAVIDAVLILNGNDTNGTLGAMSFANSGLTPTKITALLDLDSLIIYRQISEGMISANVDVPEAYALVGEDNYDSGYLVPGNLNIDEMYATVEAMTIMGLADLSASFDASSLSVANLQSLHYVGLGDNGVSDPYDSYIVHNMISDALDSSISSIGTIAYSGDYIKAIEIQGFINDLNTLGINSISEFSNINAGNVLGAFSDDAQVTTIFANSTNNSLTITYYFLDDLLDGASSDQIVFPVVTRTTDAYGVTVVIRNDLRDFIINNN